MDCLITPADRIFVAGHRGMAGSAICRAALVREAPTHGGGAGGGQGGRHPGQQQLPG